MGKAVGKGLREISPAALADLARSFGKADDLAGLGKGEDGLPGDLADGLPPGDFLPFSGSDFVGDADSDQAVEMYEKIRGETGDTAKIAENTGFDKDLLDRVKQHIFFDTHEIAVGPDTFKTGRFAPFDQTADLWQKATEGNLSPDELVLFRRWLSHEGVESQLMAEGIPYLSEHPGSWEDGISWSTPNTSAPTTSPPTPTPLPPSRGWPRIGLEAARHHRRGRSVQA